MDDRILATIKSDPIENFPIGDSICFKLIEPMQSNATQRPDVVNNWDYFEGALMALVLTTKETVQMFGTAFMVAPGLALTATHILSDYIDDILSGIAAPYCMGIRGDAAVIWRVVNITYNPNDDISFFSLCAASELPPDKTYYRFGITTKTPKVGESIHIIGFRGNDKFRMGDKVAFACGILASVGTVNNVFPYGIDKVLSPHPVIEISCGSLGGMSGGIAIDQDGLVIGVVSHSLETEDLCGPTYVSWIIGLATLNCTEKIR